MKDLRDLTSIGRPARSFSLTPSVADENPPTSLITTSFDSKSETGQGMGYQFLISFWGGCVNPPTQCPERMYLLNKNAPYSF